MYKKIFYCILAVIFTAAIVSCGKDGENGAPGINGKDGITPHIGEATGTWWIGTVDTKILASGQDGITPHVNDETGTWWIGSVDTGISARGGVANAFFILTFDADNGNPFNTQNVLGGGWAREPKDPKKSIAVETLTSFGLYATNAGMLNLVFDGWYAEGETNSFDFDTPITEDIILTAKWTIPTISLTSTPGANIIDQTANYINANPSEYSLLLNNNVSIASAASNRTLKVSGVKLTLIGLESERTISLSEAFRIFTVGAAGETGIELTLGNNITLFGWNANTQPVISVNNGATLTMLAGSKITGNVNSGGGSSTGYGAAVSIENVGSSFTMEGGEITGNTSTTSNSFSTGGLFAGGSNPCSIILNGGSITGNIGRNDVTVLQNTSSFILSGDAEIGTLMLNNYTNNFPTITIASGWNGNVASLNLRGTDATMSTVISWWEGKQIFVGAGFSAATMAKFSLGNFMTSTAGDTQPIGNTHYIDNTGVLMP